MGNMLQQPATAKDTHRFSSAPGRLSAGLSSIQGWRVNQEDAHVMRTAERDASIAFFAVFDGHGGDQASGKCAEALWQHVQAEIHDQHGKTPTEQQWLDEAAIKKAFISFDTRLQQDTQINDRSGCTAVTAIITPNFILCANIGDSRAILVKGDLPAAAAEEAAPPAPPAAGGGAAGAVAASGLGAATDKDNVVELSHDHKPSSKGEKARILAAGGTVQSGRVDGSLAVSRGFGDFQFKYRPADDPEQWKVSPAPEFVRLERSADQQFVVLACDGIWDVMRNREVADFCLRRTRFGCDDMGELAELLVDNCLERVSRDNMSAIIISLQGERESDEAVVEQWLKWREEGAKLWVAGHDKPPTEGQRKIWTRNGFFLKFLASQDGSPEEDPPEQIDPDDEEEEEEEEAGTVEQ